MTRKRYGPHWSRNRSKDRYSAFITLKINDRNFLASLSNCTVSEGQDSDSESSKTQLQEADLVEEVMRTRGAWDRNLANPDRITDSLTDVPPGSAVLGATHGILNTEHLSQDGLGTTKPILKPQTRRQGGRRGLNLKTVTVNPYAEVLHFSRESIIKSNDKVTLDECHIEDRMSQKPTLKLKFGSTNNVNQSSPQTPAPPSALRTPSIKLKIPSTPLSATQPKKQTVDTDKNSSVKKRKRTQDGQENGMPRPPAVPVRKITFTSSKTAPAHTPMIKLKSKGKIPKRPLGVGYDSELEDREIDPVILEGFVLRMQPGSDCDYVRSAIENGTIGVHRAQGGADVRMRVLDTQGRRGILIIRQNQYATTLVDLPCVVEGMKSWDKKGFIKSIDISQMMLVLGPCKTDEEARNYPLPDDVDPKSFQYAHGLTAPMKWVRKRRFARTKRARVDDIEAVERRVNALLEADRLAQSSRYQLLDRDPRMETDQYSSEYEDDDDAEGEDEDEEVDDYFAVPNGHHGGVVETPIEDIGQDEVDEFERMFADDDEQISGANHRAAALLQTGEQGDSSFAVTSTSASPSVTAIQTPASGPDQSSDEDEDDDADDDQDEQEKEGNENLQQVKDQIEDMQQKINEQTEVLMKTQNAILRRKIAKKIRELKDDVAIKKKSVGLAGDDDEEE